MDRAASDIASGRKALGCFIDGKFIWEPPVIASVKYFLSEYHCTFLCKVLCIKMPRLRPREGKGVSPRGRIFVKSNPWKPCRKLGCAARFRASIRLLRPSCTPSNRRARTLRSEERRGGKEGR